MLDVKTQVSPTRILSRRKVSTTIISVFLVLTLLMLFAIILLGPILKDVARKSTFNGYPVSGGYSDLALKKKVWVDLINFERILGCDNTKSISVIVKQQQNSQGIWVENWGVNACGSNQSFQIRFAPDPNGGTTYLISK